MLLIRGNLLAALFLLALFIIQEADGRPKRERGKGRKLGIMNKAERSLLRSFMRKAAKKNGVSNAEVAADESVGSDKVYSPSLAEDDTEFSRNKDIINDVFETDIVLTKKQLRQLNKELKKRRKNRRIKRKMTTYKSQRWGRVIPYAMSLKDSAAQAAINAGIRNWEEETCLRFTRQNSQSNYLNFFRGDGCYSYIGKIGGGQGVSIGDGCETKGIAAHEIGHALGFWHEQSRTDRGKYVVINTNNIRSSKIGNFEIRDDSQDFGIPYDMGSIMHYGPTYFVTDSGLRSIDSRDPNFSQTFGQRSALSFIDIKLVNAAYCSDECPRKLNCKNGGYTDPKDCSRCRCPSGLSGDCSEAAPSPGCGGDISVSSSWQTISSPRLLPNQNCFWHLKSSNGGKIEMEISRLSFPCRTTCRSFLELKINDDFQQTGARFCCNSPSRMVSETSEAVVIHETDSATDSEYSGFSFRVRSVGEGQSSARPTERPKRTRRPSSGQWGQWSEWSQCSMDCGGCGISERQRICLGRRCRGSGAEKRSCNKQPCQESPNPFSMSMSCSVSSSVSCSFSSSTQGGWKCTKVTSKPCVPSSGKKLPNDGCCQGYKLSFNICMKR